MFHTRCHTPRASGHDSWPFDAERHLVRAIVKATVEGSLAEGRADYGAVADGLDPGRSGSVLCR